jgi:hypothetical protein
MLKSNFPIIEILVFEGFHIATVTKSTGEIQYWSVKQFDVNTSGSEPVEFIQFYGVNITEFVERSINTNVKEIVAQFEKWIEPHPVLIVKLPKFAEWQHYTM